MPATRSLSPLKRVLLALVSPVLSFLCSEGRILSMHDTSSFVLGSFSTLFGHVLLPLLLRTVLDVMVILYVKPDLGFQESGRNSMMELLVFAVVGSAICDIFYWLRPHTWMNVQVLLRYLTAPVNTVVPELPDLDSGTFAPAERRVRLPRGRRIAVRRARPRRLQPQGQAVSHRLFPGSGSLLTFRNCTDLLLRVEVLRQPSMLQQLKLKFGAFGFTAGGAVAFHKNQERKLPIVHCFNVPPGGHYSIEARVRSGAVHVKESANSKGNLMEISVIPGDCLWFIRV